MQSQCCFHLVSSFEQGWQLLENFNFDHRFR
jgi:hypothetical protein